MKITIMYAFFTKVQFQYLKKFGVNVFSAPQQLTSARRSPLSLHLARMSYLHLFAHLSSFHQETSPAHFTHCFTLKFGKKWPPAWQICAEDSRIIQTVDTGVCCTYLWVILGWRATVRFSAKW